MKDYKEIEFRTWQLKVILDNTFETYQYILKNGEEMIALSDNELSSTIKRNTPRELLEGIKWEMIEWDQIRDNIRDLFEEAKA